MKISEKRKFDLSLQSINITEYKYSIFFKKDYKSARIVKYSLFRYKVIICDFEQDIILDFHYFTFFKCLKKVSYFFNCV